MFSKKHIDDIKKGLKTQTRRVHGHFRAKVGSVHQCRLTLFGQPQCYILILREWQERLGDISVEDAIKEGGYSPEEYIKGFIEMHEKRKKVTADKVIEAYQFKPLLQDEYRQPGENWRDELKVTLRKVMPVFVDFHPTGNVWSYRCETCGKLFHYNREIHVPECDSCREKDIETIIARGVA